MAGTGTLEGLPGFERLCPSVGQREAFEGERDALADSFSIPPAEVEPGCVVRLDRGFPAVALDSGIYRAEFSAALSKGATAGRVAVGDWVALRLPEGHDKAIILKVLPRESELARWRGGSRGEKQVLAANVDMVLAVQALGPSPVPCERLIRSAVIAAGCGMRCAVVLTKADLAADLAGDIGRVRAVFGPDIPVVASSALESGDAGGPGGGATGPDGDVPQFDAPRLQREAEEAGALWGLGAIRALVPQGCVAVMLGSSGAGKSSLLNALIGSESLRTGAVRASDGAGRHTTVERRMVPLAGAGVVIDAPGLRSLPLLGHERGLDLLYPRIADAAGQCRFRNCTHQGEPGCAVREALGRGRFTPQQLDAYVFIAGEMRSSQNALDPDVNPKN